MWHRVKLTSLAGVLFFLLNACVVQIPVGGTSTSEAPKEIIIQTEQRHLKGLAKSYRNLGWTELRTLNAQTGMYLVLIYPGTRDCDLIISDLRRDARIRKAEWNKPMNQR